MTEQPSLEAEVTRGRAAQQILENELFNESFQEVLKGFNDKLINSAPDAWKYREECYNSMRGAQAFLAALTRHMQTGQMAEMSLDQSNQENH